MPLVTPPVRGVLEVHASRIGELIEDGRMPTLLRSHVQPVYDPPTLHDLSGMRWFIAGRPDAPSAAMALRPRYHFAYMRRVLEIEHIVGSKFGVVRLMKQAQVLAAAAGMFLTGESAITNFEMFDVAIGMGFFKERARVTWRPQ